MEGRGFSAFDESPNFPSCAGASAFCFLSLVLLTVSSLVSLKMRKLLNECTLRKPEKQNIMRIGDNWGNLRRFLREYYTEHKK